MRCGSRLGCRTRDGQGSVRAGFQSARATNEMQSNLIFAVARRPALALGTDNVNA